MSVASLGGARSWQTRQALQQSAGAVLMIRPAAFDYNPQTALTNALQKPRASASPAESQQAQALTEFNGCVRALQSEGISVCVVEDTEVPVTPDAVFPNNWVSFHHDGTVVLYPMQAQNRRQERRTDVVDAVADRLGYRISRVLDLTHHENQGRFLEGTGSLVLDHVQRVAYACLSPRTHPDLVEEWANQLGYDAVCFEACDRSGVPYYHTNVMLSVGTRAVIVGSEAISQGDRRRVLERLASSGREVIEIDHEEIEHFAGNLLELATWDEALGDCRILVLSETARRGLRTASYEHLAASADGLLAIPVPSVETSGGGSIRCMLAEVFLNA
jgi:hypothetical protein